MKISVIEDNEWYNKLIVHTLCLNPDYEVETFHTSKAFFNNTHFIPNIITLDYRLPDATGKTMIPQIKELFPNAEIIIISEQEDIEIAVDLLKLGAYDYLVKSKDIKQRLLHTIQNIHKNFKLHNEVINLKKEIASKYDFKISIIGQSKTMLQVFELMSKTLNTNINVSISGETGTGKEIAAKAIHFNSNRKNEPFIAINMAAVPPELFESELFGHEKGAFTGAHSRRIGKFEEAANGTLFLDEIGELEMSAQAKLLRALQEREIVRVGSNITVKIHCRIIIATNKDLKKEVNDGRFREDLFYRLIGISIELPPLRDREHDVLLLAKYFLDLFAKENKMPTKEFSENAKIKLLNYSWPGNVRELKSIVELAFVMANNDLIDADNITLNNSLVLNNFLSENLTLKQFNEKIIQLFMKKYANNTKLVAQKLAIGQTTVYRYLKSATS